MSSLAPTQSQLVRLTNPPEAPSRFHKFPELPGELRRAVWDMVEYKPRIIQLVLDGVEHGIIRYDLWGYPRYGRTKYTLKGICKNPSMLQACRESRYHALKHYSLVFRTRLCGRPVYIDWSQDIIYITSRRILDTFLLRRAGPPMRPEGREEIQVFKRQCKHIILGQQDLMDDIRLPWDMPNLAMLDFGNRTELSARAYNRISHLIATMMKDLWTHIRGEGKAIPTMRVFTPSMLRQYTGCRLVDGKY